MPDLVMHYYFGRKLIETLPSEIVNNITNINLYDFASAGPDPFFFVSFWNKKKNRQSLEFGNYMHRHNTRLFLSTLTKISRDDKKMFSYLCGFVAHYALDVMAHPYVFHKTGVYRSDDEESLMYRGLHTKLERAMDTFIIKKEYNDNPHKFKIHKEVLKLKKLSKDYQDSFNKLFTDVYNYADGFRKVNKSIIDQRKFYKFIYDPRGFKQKLLSKLDNGTSGLDLKVLSYYNKEIKDIDIFNEKKKLWVNPADKTMEYYFSFWDLFGKALEMAQDMINYLYKVIYLGVQFDEFKIPNVTYIDGLECESNKPMQYFNNIFKEES